MSKCSLLKIISCSDLPGIHSLSKCARVKYLDVMLRSHLNKKSITPSLALQQLGIFHMLILINGGGQLEIVAMASYNRN